MSSNVARLRALEPSQPAAPSSVHLGPAEVIATGALAVEVALPDGRRLEARPALAFSYEPQPGDTVLVIVQEEAWVIGVVASQGKGVLAFPGDLDVRAVGGRLRLTGDAGVAVNGPSMEVQVGKLELVARTVTQRFHSLRQRVTELLSVHAGESHTTVDGTSHLQADRASILTRDKVSLNGKAIHLG